VPNSESMVSAHHTTHFCVCKNQVHHHQHNATQEWGCSCVWYRLTWAHEHEDGRATSWSSTFDAPSLQSHVRKILKAVETMKETKHVQLRGGSTRQNRNTLQLSPAQLGDVSPGQIIQIKLWAFEGFYRLSSCVLWIHGTHKTRPSTTAKPVRLCGFMPVVEAH
jgi:hypothetical protein